MSKKSLATGTSPFAHLLSGFRGARAEDDKPEDDEARKARRAEEDEKRKQEDARRAEEDERRNEEDARRAEEDGADPDDTKNDRDIDAEDGDEDQDPEADSSDGDDDMAEEGMDDKEKKAFRRGLALGRSRENARAARIFANPACAGRPELAATLAFTTRNTSAEAGRLLSVAGAAPKPRGRTLSDRMGNRTEARPGAEGGTAAKPSFGPVTRAAPAAAEPTLGLSRPHC